MVRPGFGMHDPGRVFHQAAEEWAQAFRLWRLWTALGREDLSDKYRRTLFGVSWLVTSFALFIVIYIVVFGQGSGMRQGEYALYVTIGFGMWTFINSAVSDACVAYIGSAGWIQGSSIPYPVFFLQTLYRDLIVFTLSLLVILGMLLWQKETWTWAMLYAVPGLLVYILPPIWLSAIFAPLCARYRDALHGVQTLLRLLFFATPILWQPGQRTQLALIAKYNVLTYFIDIVRTPLVYDFLPVQSWKVVIATNVVGIVAGFVTYAMTRNRVVYWL